MKKECDAYKGLLMGLMDGELTAEEVDQVNGHLIRCADCREEYDALQQSGSHLDGISFQEPGDRALNQVWKSPYSRKTRNMAIFLILGGWMLMLLFSLYQFFIVENDQATIPKIAFAGIVVGALILLVSVTRERMKTYKNDPYKEVER